MGQYFIADRSETFITSYSRRNFLGLLASFSAGALVSGCGKSAASVLNPSTESTLTNPQPVPNGSLASGSLSISSFGIGQIPPQFLGLSYEKSALATPFFSPTNKDLINIFRLIGPAVLRIGGNSVDQSVWNSQGKGQIPGEIAPPDVDALAGFLKATGWNCIYAVNLGGAARGQTNPALAAEEVAYMAQQLGGALQGIEIGNECECYGATDSYFTDDWSLSRFISFWTEFRDAIVATTPSVNVTGPASGTSVSQWTIPFAQSVTSREISLITQHYYRGSGLSSSATLADLISPDPNLDNALSSLQKCASGLGIPYRIAECNSYYNGGAMKVSDTYASALWVLDFLFHCAAGGASGVNLHGGGSAPGYTPIADSNAQVIEVRPEFYGVLLFNRSGCGKLLNTVLSSANNATAYAVQAASGSINVIIVNKGTQNLNLDIRLPHSAASASLISLSQSSAGAAPDLAATSGIAIQGSPVACDGSLSPDSPFSLPVTGTDVTCYVPALSAVLIRIL